MLHLNSHPGLHPIFEALGYALGFAAYKRARQGAGDILDEQQRWSVIAAAAVGALLGSRILGLLEQAPRTHIAWSQVLSSGGGKTIVGGHTIKDVIACAIASGHARGRATRDQVCIQHEPCN